MTSARRIGAPDAKNRGLLLDAAEQLMIEEGYAAVTSRRLANKAGLKPQLVHYYFRTMEELFLEVFRRRGEEALEVHAQAAAVAAAAVGAVAIRHRSRIHPDFHGIHGAGQSPQGDAGRNRLLRRTFPRRTTPSGDVGAAALWRGHRGDAAGGVDGADDQLVEVPGARAGGRDFRRSRRNLGTGRRVTCAGLEGEPQPIEGVPETWVVHQFRSEQSTPLGPSLDTTTAPSTARTQ